MKDDCHAVVCLFFMVLFISLTWAYAFKALDINPKEECQKWMQMFQREKSSEAYQSR